MWWQDAVIYQIYPRSFQDSDGDGLGDLPGIRSRLDHVVALGAGAIWLSPFYRSPDADFGYDVSDYTSVDPRYGTLEDFDALAAAAHARGLKLLVDFVPCHTSVEHPWFRERPEFYFWADAPPNNWQATFGGSAWAQDPGSGRFYLHSFFPEQADLNWRNPDVAAAIADALRFWLARGVDGFRVDAIDRLLKDPDLRDDPPATEPFPLPLLGEYGSLSHVHSANAPDIGTALRALRAAVGDAFLVGEAYLPTASLAPYLETLDAAFAFEAMNAGPDAGRLRGALADALAVGKIGWVLSNHDFSRFASRYGDFTRAAAVLFFSLPGPLFMLAGDEIGMLDGPGADPPLDRAGRDGYRHPMQWEPTPRGGFTSGAPWLELIDPERRSVRAQAGAPDSMLGLFRRLIGMRADLGDGARFLDSPAGTVLLERGEHLVAANFSEQEIELGRAGSELLLEGRAGDGRRLDRVPARGAWIARSPRV